MIVQMDNISAPSSRELAQRLYDKNIEIENNRRRSVQARNPSDPNAWQQMRENFEGIILEDQVFSEHHNIEYSLWQLHYKRFEELKAQYHAALASASSTISQGGKVPTRPDRRVKIRAQLKTFLSEATGFYHDLSLKIRSKYGLPLGYFSEDSNNRVTVEKGGNKFSDTKPGLISCHRCLIYLGDLARYKGIYADGDLKKSDFAAASSYYLQAASIWPSSGNPYHQLAILASYSSDELVAVYWYFRSLAVAAPFSTARDNLIVVFEKNRQSYSQLLGDSKVSAAAVNESIPLTISKDNGKEDSGASSKHTVIAASLAKEKSPSMDETYKSFCSSFVRLNGVLFTRTSLETFADVNSVVANSLYQLLSSGPVDKLNFGKDAAENRLLIVRVISILIFTVHIVNRDTNGQTYAEILQRTVLLQNAFMAVFGFMGHIVKRCLQLSNASSSYLLPGILVFLEWLACSPDFAFRTDLDEQEATARSLFWNHCISFLNKLSSDSSVFVDNGSDGSSFFNMSKYEEGESGIRLALWEDFELRGFLPLEPTHSFLDFSRNTLYRNEGNKEVNARVKRIIEAGKILANVVRVNDKAISFDSKVKKFKFKEDKPNIIESNGIVKESPSELITNSVTVPSKEQLYIQGEEDDEEIVFVPTLTEKRIDIIGSKQTNIQALEPSASFTEIALSHGSSRSPHTNHLQQKDVIDEGSQPIQSHVSNLSMEHVSLSNGLKNMGLLPGNGHVGTIGPQMNTGISQAYPASQSLFPPQQFVNGYTNGIFNGQIEIPETWTKSRADIVLSSGLKSGSLTASTSRINPISRPVRHLGPPPGFSHVQLPPKYMNTPVYASNPIIENQLKDDFSRFDGYKGVNNSHIPPNGNITLGSINYPYPGKQNPKVQFQLENQNGWQHNQHLDRLKYEQPIQYQQPRMDGVQEFGNPPLPEQYQGKNVRMGPHFV